MKKQLHKLLLLVAVTFFAANGYAYDVKIDDIYYDLDTENQTASVTYDNTNRERYTGTVTIPASITLPDGTTYSVTSIGDWAFEFCSGLTSISIPSSVTNIGNWAFSGCSGLTSINIPVSVTSIGSCAFKGCSGLTSISIPSSVTSIGNWAFSGCSGLTSINIPSSITSIENGAFSGCSGLTSISIPSSVTSIESGAFMACTLESLFLFAKLSSYSSCFDNLSSSILFAYSSEIYAIKRHYSGTVENIEDPYYISVSDIRPSSLLFTLIVNKYVPATLQSVTLGETGITSDENGIYTANGLLPDTSYDIVVTYSTADGERKSYTRTVTTKRPMITAKTLDITQTTITLLVEDDTNGTYPNVKKGFWYDGTPYYSVGDKVIFRNLIPNKDYEFTPFAVYSSMEFGGNAIKCRTASLNPAISPSKIEPTSISIKGSYTEKDAHVSETGFTNHGSGNTLILTGLTPNTSYTVEYYVRTKEGGLETISRTFTTSELELTTLQPRCVSSSCAIVAAETNIGEDETNAGFQWKKYDAPASLKPSEGYAAIYGGQLEGYIRNLQPTSYYNVRAFYKTAEGNYYYGDWVTFDPSDFSYFEPTVHTYAATAVTHHSAQMRGYILAGTDAIEEQGFEYWPISASAVNALRVKAAANAADNVQTVLATGQVMTAELRDLEPSTTYCCRAFVKTSSGTTYGEEQTFTTEAGTTGIGDITAEPASARSITGYYDLSGRKSDTPHRGVNIVRYSDGSTRKVIMK